MKKETLKRFTACFAFIFDVDYSSLRNFIDTDTKIHCASLALANLNIPVKEIADYYRIDSLYLEKRAQEMQVDILVDDWLKLQCEGVINLWNLIVPSGIEKLG